MNGIKKKTAPQGQQRHHYQFRIAFILILVLIVSLALVGWLRIISPKVAGVSVNGGQLVVHLTDTAGKEMLSDALVDDAYFSALANSDEAFFHDSYVSLPLLYFVLGVVACFAIGLLSYFGLRRIRRQNLSRV